MKLQEIFLVVAYREAESKNTPGKIGRYVELSDGESVLPATLSEGVPAPSFGQTVRVTFRLTVYNRTIRMHVDALEPYEGALPGSTPAPKRGGNSGEGGA